MLSVLLSASVTRFFVSHMRDFLCPYIYIYFEIAQSIQWRVCYQRGLPRQVLGYSFVYSGWIARFARPKLFKKKIMILSKFYSALKTFSELPERGGIFQSLGQILQDVLFVLQAWGKAVKIQEKIS